MLAISKKVQYGLRAMIFLAKSYRQKGFVTIKEISEKEGISSLFLEKIFLNLKKAKLVLGKKGVKGGYSLAKPPSQISLRDIIVALEKKENLVNCFCCEKSKRCLAKEVWKKINYSFYRNLKSIKLSKII